MSYTKINWKNLPNKTTPLNAENLNRMDEAIATNTTNIATNAAAIQTLNTELSTKQDLLYAGNGGILLRGSNISLNTNFIFYTLLENAQMHSDGSACVNLSGYINYDVAENFRYFIIDFVCHDFNPTQSQTLWVSAEAVKAGWNQSSIYALMGEDGAYLLTIAMVFKNQSYLYGRKVTSFAGGTGDDKWYFYVTRIQGVR